MAEVEVQDRAGRIWTADAFALERGYRYGELEFARILSEVFRIVGYERMQQLWLLRDRSMRQNVSGTFPEGADISLDL